MDVRRFETEFYNIDFSNSETILGLIVLRSKIDKYYKWYAEENLMLAEGQRGVNQELIALYADLDNLIENAGLDDNEIMLVHALEMGYTYFDLGDAFREYPAVIERRGRSIARKIVRRYMREFRTWKLFNGKKMEWKDCRICGESLPLCDAFFNTQDDLVDGFRNECRNCLNNLKNANK